MMSTLEPNKDPLGQAALDFLETSINTDINIESDIAADDVIPSSYLFRTQSEMPPLELKALQECRGKILDIGAAAGCHSLELQKMGKEVISVEVSGLCCQVMKQRGVKSILHNDFFNLAEEKYDTLLLLMNGIGIAGTLEGLGTFLKKASGVLNRGGRIVFDSSDLSYLFAEDDGSEWVNLNSAYYGELRYKMAYQNIVSEEFPWLFIDFSTLERIAKVHGFDAELFAKGDHYDYLGILTKV